MEVKKPETVSSAVMEILNLTNEDVTLSLHLKDGSSGTLQIPSHPEKVRVPNLPGAIDSVEWYTKKDASEKKRASIDKGENGSIRVTLRSHHQEEAQNFERKHVQPTLLPDPDLSKYGPQSLGDPRLRTLVERLESTKEKFVDGYFPNEKLQGIKNISQHRIEFHRPDVMMNRSACFPETCPEDVDLQQGVLGDCWVIATLAIMYSHDVALIRKMIVMIRPDIGLYVVRFMKFGTPVYVIVDDRLPFFTDSGRLCFASHVDERSLWGPLIEKAYAKLLGGYHRLMGGKIGDALMDFTGHASKSINISRNRHEKLETLKRVSRLHKKNGLIELLGCSVRGTQGDGEVEEKLSNGLYAGHAYAILAFREVQIRMSQNKKREQVILVELMNPWGKNSWRGAFGKTSNLWKLNPDLMNTLKYDPNKKTRGTFWMQMKDFCTVFDRIEGVLYYKDQLQHTQRITSNLKMKSIHGTWNVESSGGAHGAFWGKNPQYHISYKREMGDCSMFSVYLLQQDMNWKLGRGVVSRKSLYNVGVQIWKAGEGKSRLEMMFAKYCTNPRINSQYSRSKSVFQDFSMLPSGEYILMPTTANRGEIGSFIMIVYVVFHFFFFISKESKPRTRNTQVQ